MLKFLAAGVVGCAGLVCTADQAAAGHRGGCCAPCAPAAVAPAPAPMAQAPQGYRAYSYQPAPSSYRAYGTWVTGRAYENAANKSLGRGF
ncbi:MAG TPA: hypothetical protein VFV87_09385 [Pirellulaceae bacterium]|nr:hypothetical protein [Pirellulaceae bacterium]